MGQDTNNKYLKAAGANIAAAGRPGMPTKFMTAKDGPSEAVLKEIVATGAAAIPNVMIGGQSLQDMSLALNSQIAIAEHDQTERDDDPASSSAGTCQPHQVTPGSSTRRATGADVQVGEDEPAHRVDRVGERVDPVQHRQPAGQAPTPGTARRR
jgi:hypothetical protein